MAIMVPSTCLDFDLRSKEDISKGEETNGL